MTDRDTIMARFALVMDWTWHHRPTGVFYRVTRDRETPAEGLDRALHDFVAATRLGLGTDWTDYGTVLDAVHSPSPEPYEYDPARHHARIAALQARLEEAGIGGADEVRNTLTGWLTPMEMGVDGLVRRIALHEGPVEVTIQQIKEKLGVLRLYRQASDTTLFHDLSTIARWVEACSVGRCLITGQPGAVVGPGWIATLSPEMAELRERDRDRFRTLMYPEKP